ncbi:MAG TPA: NAD-dependent epimerase/dehydratase family protein [Gemmatimonadales bacterium]|nr:NAD-dependent epimerase/dehydratase family protein [Gemmatimonadales bacterium]
MRFLVIGGTGFIGPFLVHELERRGHCVAVFHRGQSAPAFPVNVQHILGDRRNLGAHAAALQRFAPDVVIDMILSSRGQAEALVATFRGVARRVVVLSSVDVYRACGVLHGTEPGPLEPVPLTEDSPLRTRPPYPPQALERLQGTFAWVDDDYDKVPVERVALGCPVLPGTVLRLPMVYGPGDRLHRLYPLLKRMDDGRKRILLADEMAAWRGPRGYVENVARAVARAATSPRAAGRVYNVAEEPPYTELEWAKLVAARVGWHGAFRVLPRERMPEHLRVPGNLLQHWSASSRRIRTELRYREPVSVGEALRRTIVWERANPPADTDPKQFNYAAEDAADPAP